MSSWSWVGWVANIIFGSVGFVAFVYGKKVSSFKPMALGLVLMLYPWFVSSEIILVLVGAALCVALVFPRS